MSYRLTACGGENIETGTQFPFVVGNSDYAAYLAWIAAGNTPAPADPVPNPRIAEIKAELLDLDVKRIRPLAEGDTEYLAALNAQAVALRTELTALTSSAAS